VPHNIRLALVGAGLLRQGIGEEKYLEYRKHDKQLDEYYCPQFAPYRHGFETIGIKSQYVA
jgi:hypothetical protein